MLTAHFVRNESILTFTAFYTSCKIKMMFITQRSECILFQIAWCCSLSFVVIVLAEAKYSEVVTRQRQGHAPVIRSDLGTWRLQTLLLCDVWHFGARATILVHGVLFCCLALSESDAVLIFQDSVNCVLLHVCHLFTQTVGYFHFDIIISRCTPWVCMCVYLCVCAFIHLRSHNYAL